MAVGLSREVRELMNEELMNAAKDFYWGTEETELSKAFFGPMVDWTLTWTNMNLKAFIIIDD